MEENKNSKGDFIWGKDNSTQVSGSVKSINNRIYYYIDVNHQSILDLIEQIKIITNKNKILSIENDIEPPLINLHISSYGGSIFACFAGMDTIKYNSVPINTIVEGGSASAATLLSICGYKRFIRKNSYMLIHQLSSGLYGKFMEIQDCMENLEKLMNTIKQVYIDNTKIPITKLNEILKHDLWFNAEECLEYGLVDEIIN